MLRRLPKTELHLHLDGSLPFEFIQTRAAARGIAFPASTPQELRNYVHEMKTKAREGDSSNAQEAGKNWGVFDWCNQFLQTKEELTSAAALICQICAEEHHVFRTELRFCPTLHTQESLTSREAVDAVVAGVQQSGYGGVIICALRSHDASHSLEMAQLTIDAHRDTGGVVCGFDIAGDEGSFPLSIHEDAIRLVKENNVPVTVHAGEWPGTSENLRLALALGVDRIGHGWGMSSHPSLMELCVEKDVTVEVCLTSNVKPGAGEGWIESYETHPIRTMVDAGVKVCLNSDNMLLSGGADRPAHATGEIEHLMSDCGFSIEEVVTILRNGAEASFVRGDDAAKRELLKCFDDEMTRVLESFEYEDEICK